MVIVAVPYGAAALPDDKANRMVNAARELLGKPYYFGGRLKDDEGIDCQGVMFYAAERISECGWKSFSTMPTRSVSDGELGDPVEGLSPIHKDNLIVDLLAPGDIILFVQSAENPKEPNIAELNGKPVWVWHTAIYSGNGKFIVGDHLHGKVVETSLRHYLDHTASYDGVFITRMAHGPTPKRCRKHSPMGSAVR